MELFKVSANSRTPAVAGAIAGVAREYQRAEVQAIGAKSNRVVYPRQPLRGLPQPPGQGFVV
jgi:stage V sporulation protein SpoVS